MIFAVPGLSVKENALTAVFLADCGQEHISAYELSYETGTPLTRALEAGTISAHGDEAAGEMYTQICALLRGQGYEHYEISNFAKPGFASRHNLHYWACGEYYAFGAAAHGYLNGRRFSVVRDTDAYIARTRGEVYDESCDDFPAGRISDEEAEEERIFLGLRTAEGILLTPALEAKLESQAAFFTRCEEAGLLARNGGRPADRRGLAGIRQHNHQIDLIIFMLGAQKTPDNFAIAECTSRVYTENVARELNRLP